MEPEYIENYRTDETGIIHEEKTICNQPLLNTDFRGSIIFLKIPIIQVRGGRAFMHFVVFFSHTPPVRWHN